MEDLDINTTEEAAAEQALSQPDLKPKKSLLRVVASLLTLVATLSFWVCAGIITYIIIAGTTGVADLFGIEEDVLGIVSLTGFIAYLAIIMAIAVVIGIAVSCTVANAKYRRMVRFSHKFNSALFAVSDGAVASIAYLYGTWLTFGVTWGFLMIWTGINNAVGYAGIACLVLQAVACVVATIERVICKEKFDSLPQEEQSELKSQSRAIKEAIKTKDKKKRIGKLY